MSSTETGSVPADSADVGGTEDRLSLNPLSTVRLGWVLLVTGLLGLVAALTLSIERVELLLDPSYVPSCSINPIVSCGSVMTSEQASVLGFPNPFIGLAAFPVVVTLGVVTLARVQLPRFVLLGLNIGAGVAMGFVGWLVAQSLYSINALCPYCMVVWVAVTVLLVQLTAYNLDTGTIPVPEKLHHAVGFLVDMRLVVVMLVLALITVLVLVRFWYYWSTLLPF